MCVAELPDKSMTSLCTLSHVCVDWRTVALEHKPLWSFGQVSRLEELHRVAVPLHRSEARSFDLTVDWNLGGLNVPDGMWGQLRENLRRLVWRGGDTARRFLILLGGRHPIATVLPVLEELSIEDSLCYNRCLKFDNIRAPELTKLSLYGTFIGPLAADCFSRLSYLALSLLDSGPNNFEELFGAAPNLCVLVLSNTTGAIVLPDWIPENQTQLGFLEELVLEDADETYAIFILSTTRFPKLRKLTISVSNHEHEPQGSMWSNDSGEGLEGTFRPSLSNGLHKTIMESNLLEELRIEAPTPCIRATLHALLRQSTLALHLRSSSLKLLSLSSTDVTCVSLQEHCPMRPHIQSDGLVVGIPLIETLRARGHATLQLERLCVDSCMVVEGLESMAESFTPQPCDCPSRRPSLSFVPQNEWQDLPIDFTTITEAEGFMMNY